MVVEGRISCSYLPERFRFEDEPSGELWFEVPFMV